MIVTLLKLTACIRTFSFPFFLLFYCSSLFGQQKITGIVLSADSLLLEGGVIIVKNSKQGTLSRARFQGHKFINDLHETIHKNITAFVIACFC